MQPIGAATGRLSEYHLSSAASESFLAASLGSGLQTFDAFLAAFVQLVNLKGLPPAEVQVLIPALVRAAVKLHIETQSQREEQGGGERTAEAMRVEMHSDNPSRQQGLARGGTLRPRPLQHSSSLTRSRHNRPAAAAEPELQQKKLVRKVSVRRVDFDELAPCAACSVGCLPMLPPTARDRNTTQKTKPPPSPP